MLPLMRMTWILNRRLLIGFSPVLAFYLAVLLKTQSMAEAMPRPFIACFIGIASLITLIITFQGLTLDVEGFLLSLPVSRAAVVRNKYLTSLLGLMAGIALPLATSWIGHLFAPRALPAPSPEALGIVGLAALLLALGIFLFLPFIHHFGPSKGFLYVSLAALVLPAAGLAWRGLDGAEAVITFGKGLSNQTGLSLAIGAGALAFGWASMALSIWSYRRRSF